jgi:molybdate transport system ATP-binding protein
MPATPGDTQIAARLFLKRRDFVLDVEFSAGHGITALFGPSGSGKSTVLNLIAGLARLDRGHIEVDGEVFADTSRRIDLSPHHRRVGYVFQDALLFPHLNVRRNLGYGRWFSKSPDSVDFDQIVDLLGITHLLDRRPATLSGGERQRVAIGRALLSNPRLLLMDEPLAALDIERKAEIIPYVERLRDDLGLPILYVSHAVDEVARLADRVTVLADGRITAQGSASEILGPKISAGADRFARLAVLSGSNPAYDERWGLTSVDHPAGRIAVAGRVKPHDGHVRIVVRATDVTLSLTRPHEISVRTMLKGTIAGIEESDGPIVIAEIALEGGDRLAAAITRKAVDELGLDAGDTVYCLIKAVSIDERLMLAP